MIRSDEFEREKEKIEIEKISTQELFRKQFLQKQAEVLHKSEGSLASQIQQMMDDYYRDSPIYSQFTNFKIGVLQLVNILWEDNKRREEFYNKMNELLGKIINEYGTRQEEEKEITVEDVTEERQTELIKIYDSEPNRIKRISLVNPKVAGKHNFTEIESEFLKQYGRKKKNAANRPDSEQGESSQGQD